MKRTILLGYGNPDRGDDGVAWHFLHCLLRKYHKENLDLLDFEVFPLTNSVDIWFNLQLLPETSETIANYDQAIFIDAHTGEIRQDINLQIIEPKYLNSPFTHHITASTVLSLAKSIAGKYPEAWLLSIRGFEFEFDRILSKRTNQLITQALRLFEKEFLI